MPTGATILMEMNGSWIPDLEKLEEDSMPLLFLASGATTVLPSIQTRLLEEADRVVMQYHCSHGRQHSLCCECQGRFSFNWPVFFVSFVGNNEVDIEARDPATDLFSEEVKRVKESFVNGGMVDAMVVLLWLRAVLAMVVVITIALDNAGWTMLTECNIEHSLNMTRKIWNVWEKQAVVNLTLYIISGQLFLMDLHL